MISKQLSEKKHSLDPGGVYISRLNRVVGERRRKRKGKGFGADSNAGLLWADIERVYAARRISSFRSSSPRLGERLLERDDDDAFEAPF